MSDSDEFFDHSGRRLCHQIKPDEVLSTHNRIGLGPAADSKVRCPTERPRSFGAKANRAWDLA